MLRKQSCERALLPIASIDAEFFYVYILIHSTAKLCTKLLMHIAVHFPLSRIYIRSTGARKLDAVVSSLLSLLPPFVVIVVHVTHRHMKLHSIIVEVGVRVITTLTNYGTGFCCQVHNDFLMLLLDICCIFVRLESEREKVERKKFAICHSCVVEKIIGSENNFSSKSN